MHDRSSCDPGEKKQHQQQQHTPIISNISPLRSHYTMSGWVGTKQTKAELVTVLPTKQFFPYVGEESTYLCILATMHATIPPEPHQPTLSFLLQASQSPGYFLTNLWF